MKKIFHLLILSLISTNIFSQVTWGSQQIISTSADYARSVYSCDIDGDGDNDVLSASLYNIAWYVNDGNGNFSSQQIVTDAILGGRSVFACDIDGDGDNDVLSASFNDDKIAWYENTNGLGSFGTQQIISSSSDGPESVFACDLDGDGDNDVLSASSTDGNIVRYENTDGQGSFVAHVVSYNADGAASVFACDIDGDGDNDVLSACSFDDKIVWYENNGNGQIISNTVISTNADGVRSVFACDLDGDGDNDVVSGGGAASTFDIGLFENTDGYGSFLLIDDISETANNGFDIFSCDIDGDGDNDILSASFYQNKISWHENNGNSQIISNQVISTNADGAISVFACDIDGDGDNDVLSASNSDNKIAWYRNNTTPLIITQPNNINICENNNTLFIIEANYITNFQWQVDTGSGFINILGNSIYSNATEDTLNISNATYSMNGYQYRCLAFNNNDTSFSSIALLSINPTYYSTANESVCNEDSILWQGTYYNAIGQYFENYQTLNSCDSIYELNLNIIVVNTAVSQTDTILTANTTGASYQWLDCDNSFSIITGETNQLFTATANGNYAVEITENGCTDTSFCYSVTSVGVFEYSSNSYISIYPNPTTGKITIQAKCIEKIEIMNIQGKQIYIGIKNEIDLSNEPKGIYIIKVTTKKGVAVGKVVLE